MAEWLTKIRPFIEEMEFYDELKQTYAVQIHDVFSDNEIRKIEGKFEKGLPDIYKCLLREIGPFKVGSTLNNKLCLMNPTEGLVNLDSDLKAISSTIENFDQGHYNDYLIFAKIGFEYCINRNGDAWEALIFNRHNPQEISIVSYGDIWIDKDNNKRASVGKEGAQKVVDFLTASLRGIHEDSCEELEDIYIQELPYES